MACACALNACSPALDWREVHTEAGVIALFPCKPSHDVRSITMAGTPTRMTLQACQASGATYALAFADVADPQRVGPALAMLRRSLAENLGATPDALGPFLVKGMSPNPQADRLRLNG